MAKKVRKSTSTEEIYPNQPVVEVVCEIRFSAECRRDEFQSKIRKKYPLVLVPSAKPGQALALQPYRFVNEDQSEGLMLGLSNFAYYQKNYQGHDAFLKELLRVTGILKEFVPLRSLNRFGLRYVNAIPFSRESEMIPLTRLLNLELNLPLTGGKTDYKDLSLSLTMPTSTGDLTTRLQRAVNEQTQQEALVLDFDFVMTEALQFTRLRKYAVDAHQVIRDMFENLITDEYRLFLRGDTV